MLFVFYLVLILRAGRCTDNQIFETVEVGQTATLTCARQEFEDSHYLFWIRLVSGNLPEVLGATYNFNYEDVNKTPHITKYNTKQEPGTFVLQIHQTKRSDTGVYYCVKVDYLEMTFLNRTFLRIKGPEPEITSIAQDFPPDPVRPGDSVTLQCSLLTQKKTCPGDHSVFWFRAGSDESHPSVLYAHAGTYYCAVASCGEILFGDGTKVDVEETCVWAYGVVVLTLSPVVITFLIYAIKKIDSPCCNAAAAVQRNRDGQKIQRDEDMSVYSAVVFIMMKTHSGAVKDTTAAERQRIYSAVNAFGLD